VAARSTLRASDADRERIAERLRHAAAEGRILAEELDERLGIAFRARTYGELDALVADLPGKSVAPKARSSMRTWVAPAIGLAIAIPIALAVIAAIVFIVTGVLAMWGLWLFVGWWILRSRPHHRRYPPPRGPRGSVGMYESRRAQPRPGYWL
jgi:DUF1707 SHOCT-like domain